MTDDIDVARRILQVEPAEARRQARLGRELDLVGQPAWMAAADSPGAAG